MAEIAYQFQILLNNGQLSDSYQSQSQGASQSSAKMVKNVQAVSNLVHAALNLGDVVTPGWSVFVNLDDTNYVEIGVEVTGAFHPLLKLKPGERAMCRVGATPYAKANSGVVELFYSIYED
jgi:hypothetical protein